jgi:hypothetical protein
VPPPPAIRFHAGLKHPSGGVWPVMVALVTLGVDSAPIAIARYWKWSVRRKCKNDLQGLFMVGAVGIEPVTPPV